MEHEPLPVAGFTWFIEHDRAQDDDDVDKDDMTIKWMKTGRKRKTFKKLKKRLAGKWS